MSGLNGGRIVGYGEDGADYFYVDHTDSGQALFYGGAGDDVFQAGWLTEFHAVGGDLTSLEKLATTGPRFIS